MFAGEYLALTGEKLNGVEMLSCGLATHYAHSAVCILNLNLVSQCIYIYIYILIFLNIFFSRFFLFLALHPLEASFD